MLTCQKGRRDCIVKTCNLPCLVYSQILPYQHHTSKAWLSRSCFRLVLLPMLAFFTLSVTESWQWREDFNATNKNILSSPHLLKAIHTHFFLYIVHFSASEWGVFPHLLGDCWSNLQQSAWYLGKFYIFEVRILFMNDSKCANMRFSSRSASKHTQWYQTVYL